MVPGQLPVGVHGVAGEIQTGDLLLHRHKLLGGELREVPQDQLDRRLTAVLGLGEEVKLPLQILALVPGQAVEELLVGVQ